MAVACLRLLISLVVFLPWLLRRPVKQELARLAMALGAVQFGLMYIFYIAAYQYLPAYAVALYTIFTPLYVAGLADALVQRWRRRHTLAAMLAVVGAAIVTVGSLGGGSALRGIGLLQMSNLCFAAGQVGYRRLVAPGRDTAGTVRSDAAAQAGGESEVAILGWMYLGATLVTAVVALVGSDRARLGFDRSALLVLLYLGLVPTALGFYLWNKGAVRVRSGVLAAANNLKIPLAVLCTWLIFSESADHVRVIAGLAFIVAALFVAGRDPESAH